MSPSWRPREYEALLRELTSEHHQQLLRRLQWNHSRFRSFSSWIEFLAYMRAKPSDEDIDEALRAILYAHEQGADPAWRTLLLVVFWPGLATVHRQRRRWDSDPVNLWLEIEWAFLRVVSTYRVKERPERIPQKLINSTCRDVLRSYKKIWQAPNKERALDPADLAEAAGAAVGEEWNVVQERESQEAAEGRVRRWLADGAIDDTELSLIIGTRLYGKPLDSVAKEVGLNYEAAKKRRQRAESRVRETKSG